MRAWRTSGSVGVPGGYPPALPGSRRRQRSVLRLFVQWKKSPLAGILGVVMTSVWKGGSHAYPTRSTVQPAEVPGWGDACGGTGFLGLGPRPTAAQPPPETTKIRLI